MDEEGRCAQRLRRELCLTSPLWVARFQSGPLATPARHGATNKRVEPLTRTDLFVLSRTPRGRKGSSVTLIPLVQSRMCEKMNSADLSDERDAILSGTGHLGAGPQEPTPQNRTKRCISLGFLMYISCGVPVTQHRHWGLLGVASAPAFFLETTFSSVVPPYVCVFCELKYTSVRTRPVLSSCVLQDGVHQC